MCAKADKEKQKYALESKKIVHKVSLDKTV